MIFGARKCPSESKGQSLLRDMHAPAGARESRSHLRDGKISRKALAMAYIHRNDPARSEWRCRHRLGLLVKRTANQNRGGRRVLMKRKALSRLRACSLLGEPLSDRIGRQWRFLNARNTRALARYGRSACGRGVYPSHLAASFSTVPSSCSFLMASLMALVSSGLSLFTATAYSSPVATSTTICASL